MFMPLRETDVTAQPRPISALHTSLPMKPLPPRTTMRGAIAVLRERSASILSSSPLERALLADFGRSLCGLRLSPPLTTKDSVRGFALEDVATSPQQPGSRSREKRLVQGRMDRMDRMDRMVD